jgi:hypothetical protein
VNYFQDNSTIALNQLLNKEANMSNRYIPDRIERGIEYTKQDIQTALKMKAEGKTLIWLYSDYAEDIDKYLEERLEVLNRLYEEAKAETLSKLLSEVDK